MASIFNRPACLCGKGNTVLADVFGNSRRDVDVLMPGESEPRRARSLSWWADGATFFDPSEHDGVDSLTTRMRHWERYRDNPVRLAIDFGDERIETIVGYRPHQRYDGETYLGLGLVPDDRTDPTVWFWRRFYACRHCGTCVCGDGEPGHVHP